VRKETELRLFGSTMNSSPFELILSLSSVRTWIRGGNGNDVGSNSARERCPKFLVLSENVKGEAKKTFLLPDPRSCPAPKALLLGLFFFFSVVVTELHVRHNYYTFFDRNHPFLSAVLPPSFSSTLISLNSLNSLLSQTLPPSDRRNSAFTHSVQEEQPTDLISSLTSSHTFNFFLSFYSPSSPARPPTYSL